MSRGLIVIASVIVSTLPAAAFELSFSWGKTPACTSGRPSVVASPEFHLQDVPPGTGALAFEMTDLNAPSFRHGGATLPYTGAAIVPAGAFRYLGPCPPAGSHRYTWSVKAKDRGTTFGTTLGEASATRSFPQ